MIVQIDDKLVSGDLLTECFACDLTCCEGVCCVHGDSGAPLEEDEVEILKAELDNILPYLKPEGAEAIKKQGVAVTDFEGDLVTPLINGEECAYSFYTEDGICLCGIEKGYREGKVGFIKPISCHLYPIRTKQLGANLALNYDRWSICQTARVKGKDKGVKVFQFLKEPIVRAFGEEFYSRLEEVSKNTL